jgi:serine/threonine-protein kinase
MPTGIVGRVIARRFGVVASSGSTGIGMLYDAVELGSGRPLSLHVFDVPFDGDADELARRAAPLLAARHVRIPTTRFVGLDETGHAFSISERLRGETLRERLAAVQRLEDADVVEVARQLLEGLGALHAVGLVHGNVKPENILFMTSRRERADVRLLGHGPIALLTAGRKDACDLGTPPYLAPERLATNAPADAHVDLWAAALVIYEMLVGERAYDGATLDDVARAVAREPPPTPSTKRPDAAWADAFLAKALAKRREARHASVADLARCLEQAWRGRRGLATVLPSFSDPIDDLEGPTDLHIHVEVTPPE